MRAPRGFAPQHAAVIDFHLHHLLFAGWGEYPHISTPEQITDKLLELSTTGVDVTLVTMVDYNQELPYWNEKAMPFGELARLRKARKQICNSADCAVNRSEVKDDTVWPVASKAIQSLELRRTL